MAQGTTGQGLAAAALLKLDTKYYTAQTRVVVRPDKPSNDLLDALEELPVEAFCCLVDTREVSTWLQMQF